MHTRLEDMRASTGTDLLLLLLLLLHLLSLEGIGMIDRLLQIRLVRVPKRLGKNLMRNYIKIYRRY